MGNFSLVGSSTSLVISDPGYSQLVYLPFPESKVLSSRSNPSHRYKEFKYIEREKKHIVSMTSSMHQVGSDEHQYCFHSIGYQIDHTVISELQEKLVNLVRLAVSVPS